MGDWTADNVIKILTLLVALVGSISGVIASIRANQAKILGEINSTHLINQDIALEQVKQGVDGHTEQLVDNQKTIGKQVARALAIVTAKDRISEKQSTDRTADSLRQALRESRAATLVAEAELAKLGETTAVDLPIATVRSEALPPRGES